MAGKLYSAAGANLTQVFGLEFVRSQLIDFMPREALAVYRRTVTKVAAEGRKKMRRRAPRRTGTLRKAIKSRRSRGTRNMVAAQIYITHGRGEKYDAFYWHMVAFGTHGTHDQSPNDFVTPTVEEIRASFNRDMARVFNSQVIKQMEKRAAAQMKRAA